MRSLNGIWHGDLHIAKPTLLSGVVMGGIIIRAGGRALVYGRLDRQLVVESGAQAVVYGTLRGSIYQRGGEVQVYRGGTGNWRSRAVFLRNALLQALLRAGAVSMSGVVKDTIIVGAGGTLSVRGELGHSLTVKAGGRVELYGIIDGAVSNEGRLQIYGSIEGALYREAGMVIAPPDALIRGGVVSDAG